jgi:glycosyltransferase involved in cell wall biosynthesis
LAQTFRDWTCLLVDDGSDDGSSDICRDYAGRDTRFAVRRVENRGAYAARNVGLSWADGDSVYFCDSDDILHPELLACLASALESSGADFTYVDSVEFPEDGMPEFRAPSAGPEIVDVAFPLFAKQKCGLALWHCLFRRKALSGLSFAENIRRGADRLFVYEFLRRSPKMARVDAALYGYRQRKGSIAHAVLGEEAVAGYAEVMRRLAADYAKDPRLGALRTGEFVFMVKYVVRECELNPQSPDLPRCRNIVAELLADGVLRLRDFGLKWGWRVFRFARTPRTR